MHPCHQLGATLCPPLFDRLELRDGVGAIHAKSNEQITFKQHSRRRRETIHTPDLQHTTPPRVEGNDLFCPKIGQTSLTGIRKRDRAELHADATARRIVTSDL